MNEKNTYPQQTDIIRERHRNIYCSYFRYVYAIVYNKLRKCAGIFDIEDCVSDIFADLFVYLGKNDISDDRIKSVVSRIASNKSIDMYHKLNREYVRKLSLEEDGISAVSSDEKIEDKAERTDMQNKILKIIYSLGSPDSDIFILRYYYNRSSSDIAKIVTMKPDAVRKRCSRAKEKIRQMLEEAEISL